VHRTEVKSFGFLNQTLMSEVNNISEREKPFMHIYVTALGT
jgi:hypothetical protein